MVVRRKTKPKGNSRTSSSAGNLAQRFNPFVGVGLDASAPQQERSGVDNHPRMRQLALRLHHAALS